MDEVLACPEYPEATCWACMEAGAYRAVRQGYEGRYMMLC